MSTTRAVAKKELRAYFLSPIALLFLAAFLVAVLFTFFWAEGFFARGLADVRPLFDKLPLMLAFLVPALGMRLWAEEERAGTMEMLRTLPIRTHSLVLGKFLSGLGLVGVALLLTLPIPLSVSLLGNLDWGPVFGGYLATLLLAGAYLAITLCISAVTSSQLVALVFGALACNALYIVGAEPVTALFGHAAGEVLRNVGVAGRFESILRGVVDLRDLVYYGSLTTFFLALNVVILETRRWSEAEGRKAVRTNTRLALALAGLNLVALSFVLAPVRGARVDLTEFDEYSISDVTKDLLAGLDEPLLVRGYFSRKTHPLLAPLVPRLRDMIDEYGAIGGDKVRAEFVDPTTDPELEQEAGETYGIRSVPFSFADRHESSVVNSYFHVLIKYGDQVEVLDFEDLIEVQVVGMDVNVQLRNLEYDLTRSIQKVVYGFQSIEAVMARLPADAKLTAVITRDALPEVFAEVPAAVRKVGDELAARSGGRFSWELLDPDAPGASLTREQAQQRWGLQPFALGLFSQDSFFLHFVLEVGEHRELLMPGETMAEADIRDELTAALKRTGPGALKTVGLYVGGGDASPPPMPGMPPQGGGLPFSLLEEVLGQTYAVRDVDLAEGRVPGEVDVLMVLDPRDLGEVERWAIDQYLMRGGSVVVAAGAWVPDVGDPMGGLSVKQVDSGLDAWLGHHGIEPADEILMDLRSASFPIPVTRNLGGFQVREIQMLRYPAFPDIRSDGMETSHPALSGLPGVVLHWASPVRPAEGEGLPERTVLLRSSEESWTASSFRAQPDYGLNPELGWAIGEPMGSEPLAVAAVGPFTSSFVGEEVPAIGGGGGEDAGPGTTGGLIAASPERARLVVIGSAGFLSDPALEVARAASDAWLNNLQLAANLVDWCLEDVELLRIRSRGSQARLLEPTSAGFRQAVEWGNYAFALLAVLGIGAFGRTRRGGVAPLPLPPPASAPAAEQAEARTEGVA